MKKCKDSQNWSLVVRYKYTTRTRFWLFVALPSYYQDFTFSINMSDT